MDFGRVDICRGMRYNTRVNVKRRLPQMSARYSKRVRDAFAEVSVGDYYVDSDGHWLTLKPGHTHNGGRIVHEWTAAAMLEARKQIDHVADASDSFEDDLAGTILEHKDR
jgi:hypothetical protein